MRIDEIGNNGVVTDFVIVSLKQKKRIKKPNYKELLIIEETRRHRIFPTMNCYGFSIFQAFRGWWYSFYTKDIYTDCFFDIGDVYAESEFGNYPLIVRSKWEKTVYSLLEYYLSNTDSGSIAVLIRLDYPKREVFHPVSTLEEFWDDMQTGKIYFDEVYFISKKLDIMENPISNPVSEHYWTLRYNYEWGKEILEKGITSIKNLTKK